jgi:serine protease
VHRTLRTQRQRTLRRAIGVAAATATVVMTASLTMATAQADTVTRADAASKPAPAPVQQAGRTITVHLAGKTFHVQLHKPSGVVWMNGHHKQGARSFSTADTNATVYPPTTSTSGLQYGGGPLQTAPQIYLDFWGSQWDSDSNGVQQYMQNFFNGLGASGDTWSTVTSQYTDSNGGSPSFNGSVLGGSWTDDGSAAPSAPTQAQIAAEADNAASHFGVSGPNVDIYVMSPSGTQPDGFPNAGFCAWHNWDGNVAYTNMPYVLDAGSSCGANSVQNQLDGFSIVGGHEYAEAITDPEPSSGWVDSNGEEIGDLCAWDNDQTVSFSTGSFAMQPLYSNKDNGCVFSSQ